MRKKIILSLLILTLSLSAWGCEKKSNLAVQAVDQGKLYWSSSDYEEALNSFKLAINEGYDGEDLSDIVEKISLLENYKRGKKLFLEGRLDESKVTFTELLENLRAKDMEIEIMEYLDRIEERLAEENTVEEEEKDSVKVETPKVANDSKVDEYLEKFDQIALESQIYRNREETETMDEFLVHMEKGRVKWDDFLNETYQVLRKQLTKKEMDELVLEQREWIKLRDEGAKRESFERGENDKDKEEYVRLRFLAEFTSDRTYTLITEYMK